MKKYLLLILMIILTLSGCSNKSNTTEAIAVSIVPQKTFVEKVVGDEFKVISLIPSGSSPETYQVSPRIINELENAKIYFSIGVESEKANIIPTLKELKNLKIVSLEDHVNKIYEPRYFDKNNTSVDPHIWLSPKRTIEMVKRITEELTEIYPNKKDVFIQNRDDYIKKLNELDEYIKNRTNNLSNRDFIIYHPSYGYFAEDYHLNMIEIESEGKTASIKRLDEVVKIAREKNIKVIYYQEEKTSKQAQIIANEINGSTFELRPLSDNYIEELKRFTNKLSEVN